MTRGCPQGYVDAHTMRRLLCVFAHPDDECYGPGGTIAQCALDGVEVAITMFTAGEAGTIGVSKTLARDELARRRRLEFAASCQALGVKAHRILGAPDGGVSGVDPKWAIGEIIADIGAYRPQVVISFHYRGISQHPDHVAVNEFLLKACEQAGSDGPKVYYEFGVPKHKSMLYDRPNLAPMEPREVVAAVPIGTEAMDRKIAAIHCHETQIEFFESLQAKFDYRAVTSPEHFGVRWAGMDVPTAPISDLFAGTDGED